MKYSDYINFLNEKNINLFDHDARISYHQIFNNYNNNQQYGGGNHILSNKSIDELKLIINIATSSNPHFLYSLL